MRVIRPRVRNRSLICSRIGLFVNKSYRRMVVSGDSVVLVVLLVGMRGVNGRPPYGGGVVPVWFRGMFHSGTINWFQYGTYIMPRPRLHESTVEAIEKMANEEIEMDAEKFGVDTQLRIVLHKAASRRVGNDQRHPLKKVVEMTEEFDV